jgi:hypothetical protein
MRAPYLALLSLVIGYSAYQGTRQQGPEKPSGPPSTIENLGANPFPSLATGICPLQLDQDGAVPCGTCPYLCAADPLEALIKNQFRAELGADGEYLEKHWNVPQEAQQNVKFVIASLPDPVRTHMALLFDRGIETIQSAAQANGYLFARAWMPWDFSTHIESTDFTVRQAQTEFRNSVESLPGLMIFQKPKSGESLSSILLVFVVGETPTGGLRIEQFQNALNIRRSILAGSDPKLSDASVLRIRGPEFSGSLLSLNAVLNAQAPRDQFSRILIRSGTVSSYGAAHDFCESVRQEWPDASSEGNSTVKPPPGRPDFITFQFSNEEQEHYLSVFLEERNHPHSRIAILSEDETAFGNQEDKPASSESGSTQQPAAQTLDLCPLKPEAPNPQFVRLYFPREIAQLRDAYQRDVKSQSPADAGKVPPQNGLSLSLNITGNDSDSVAPYSPLQTPPSQEAVLQGIVASLRKEHARIVVIRGSDPLDIVFLARYLRQNYPQGRLITVGADLLLIHEFYDPRFHGILALTPYPLIPGAQFPSLATPTAGAKQDMRRVFSDSYSVGGFNAMQSLLAPTAEKEVGGLPAADYSQFGLPSFLASGAATAKSASPWSAHLWLTTIGRDAYWPVAVLDENSSANTKAVRTAGIPPVVASSVSSGSYVVHFSIGWIIFCVFMLVLTLLLARLLAYPDTLSQSEMVGRFGGEPSTERNWILFVGMVLVLACQTVFVLPSIVLVGRFGQIFQTSLLGQCTNDFSDAMWIMISYVVTTSILGLACYKGFQARRGLKLARSGVALCGIVVFVVLVLTLCAWLDSGSNDSLGLVVYRYIEVGSGVSPALPIIFLLGAWLWWSWQTLTGVASTEEKHVVFPDADYFDLESAPAEKEVKTKLVEEASERVRLKAIATKTGQWPWEALGPVPLGRRKAIVIVALVEFLVICSLMGPSEIAEAFESPVYKWIYWILLYSCLLLVCYLVSHIVALWFGFRKLLLAVDRLPFRRGFSDLKSLTQMPLWKLAGNGRNEFVQVLSTEIDALPKIDKNPLDQSGLWGAIGETKATANELSAEYEAVIDGKPCINTAVNVRKSFSDLQKDLAKTASAALVFANTRWKNEAWTPPDVKKEDQSSDSKKKVHSFEPPAQDPTLRSIERFLCLFYLNIILVPLRRLQTLILALAGVFVFVLLSYSSYPFESRESFHVLLIFIFFVISLVVGVVYGQMYANPLLSRITNTEPGELGLDFWIRLGTFVFVPLLSLLSVQFPEINNFLFSWLQPALQSVK